MCKVLKVIKLHSKLIKVAALAQRFISTHTHSLVTTTHHNENGNALLRYVLKFNQNNEAKCIRFNWNVLNLIVWTRWITLGISNEMDKQHEIQCSGHSSWLMTNSWYIRLGQILGCRIDRYRSHPSGIFWVKISNVQQETIGLGWIWSLPNFINRCFWCKIKIWLRNCIEE